MTNAWANPSQLGATAAAELVAFLDARGRMPDQAALNRQCIALLAPVPGEHILEIGCGSGALCLPVAAHVAPRGRVVGLDIAPEMLAAAQQAIDAAYLPDSAHFVSGAAEALPFATGTFDAAFAVRLLLHVADPAPVVAEMRRVLRPGGRLLVMEWDWETIAVDHPDRALTRRVLHWRCDHHGGNNWSGRQLRRWLLAAGVQDVTVTPLVSTVTSAETSLAQSLWRAADVARDGGAISDAEHAAWLAVLDERLAAGQFFASIGYFVVSGVRAAGDL